MRKKFYTDEEGNVKRVLLSKVMIAVTFNHKQHEYINQEMERLQINRSELIRRCVDRVMEHNKIEDILLLPDDISNLDHRNIPMRFYQDQSDWLLTLVEEKKLSKTEAVRRCVSFCLDKDGFFGNKGD